MLSDLAAWEYFLTLLREISVDRERKRENTQEERVCDREIETVGINTAMTHPTLLSAIDSFQQMFDEHPLWVRGQVKQVDTAFRKLGVFSERKGKLKNNECKLIRRNEKRDAQTAKV